MSKILNCYQIELIIQASETETCVPVNQITVSKILKSTDAKKTGLSILLSNITSSKIDLFCKTVMDDLTDENKNIKGLASAISKTLKLEVIVPAVKKINPKECLNLIEASDKNIIDFQSESLKEFVDDLMKEIVLSVLDSPETGISDKDIEQIEDEFADLFEGIDKPTYGNLLGGPENPKSENNEMKIINLDNLVGVQRFKNELSLIAKFAMLNRKLNQKKKKRVFPLHYIFNIEPGMGLTTMLKVLTTNLKRFGITNNSNFIEYVGSLSFEGSKDRTGIFNKNGDGSYRVDHDYAVIAINITHLMSDEQFSVNKLIDAMWDYRGKIVFVLVFEGGMKRSSERSLIQAIQSRLICRYIEFPPYTDTENLLIASQMLKNYGFDFDRDSAEYLLEEIRKTKANGKFENIRSIQRIIEVARVEKLFRLNDTGEDDNTVGYLSEDDFSQVKTNKEQVSDNSAWAELDSLIGLDEVKKTLKEIVAYAKVQQVMKEMDMETDEICYHMRFTGNPGTGKTTVARILGKMFKEIGFLKKGDVIEAGRENLIGKYIGHTAPIVKEKVREALDCVLFIDEAYSLYAGGDDKRDYGHEVISTLIKEMEDRRDQFIVIMAGYTDEMEDLFEMNSGLYERVPYKIEFRDYSADELTEIFIKSLGKSFVIDKQSKKKINCMFAEILKHKDKKFGNGRLARNLAERLKVKHSMRIYKENAFNRKDIVTIKAEDVDALCNDSEVQKLLHKLKDEKTKIGFKGSADTFV